MALENATEITQPQIAQILEQVKQSNSKIESFAALIEGSVTKGIGRRKFQQQVVFVRPGQFRLDISATNLHQTLALILFRDDFLQAFDPNNSSLYQGSVTRENIERLFSVPFSAEEFMLWFCGQFKLPQTSELQQVQTFISHDGQKRLLRLLLRDQRRVDLLLSNPQDSTPIQLLRLEIRQTAEDPPTLISEFTYRDSPSQTLSTLKEEGRSSGNDLSLPQEIYLFLPRKNLSISLHYEQSALNTITSARAEKLFSIQFPVQARLYDLDTDLTSDLAAPFDW